MPAKVRYPDTDMRTPVEVQYPMALAPGDTIMVAGRSRMATRPITLMSAQEAYAYVGLTEFEVRMFEAAESDGSDSKQED